MHRLAKRFLSFTTVAVVLAAAAGPARAQSLQELQEAIVALDVPSEKAMLHLIKVAADFTSAGKIGQAIKPLNALARVIDQETEIDSSTAEALLASVESVIDVLVAGPQQWWCDADGDGYTVDAGVSYFAPSAYCSTDPGWGLDSDDNDPNVTLLQEWWCDYDGDGYTVYMGFSLLPPSPYCINSPGFGPDCDDNDFYATC